MKFIPALLVAVLALGACTDSVPTAPETSQFVRNSAFDGATLRVFLTLDERKGGSGRHGRRRDPGAARLYPHPRPPGAGLDVPQGRGGGHVRGPQPVELEPDDPADYVTFGWWAQSTASTRRSSRWPIRSAGRWSTAGTRPRHRAAASGRGDGLVYGSGRRSLPVRSRDRLGSRRGRVRDRRVPGTVTLAADFEDATIRGCIGCVGDLVTQRRHFDVFLVRTWSTRTAWPGTTSSTSPPPRSGRTACSCATG